MIARRRCALAVLSAALAGFCVNLTSHGQARADAASAAQSPSSALSLQDINVVPLLMSDDTSESGEGPTVVNGRKQLPWMNFDLPTGALNFQYHFEHDTTTQDQKQSATTSNTFQESLSLVTNGYVISPNLLDLKLGGTVGLEQDLFDAAGTRRSSNGLLDGWDVTGVILRNEDAPLTLYTHRTEDYVTPDFSPSLRNTDTTYGGNIVYRSNNIPTQLELYHSDDSQVELIGNAHNFTLGQDVFHWHTDVQSLPHQSLVFDYNYRNTKEQESYTDPVRYENHDGSLTHVYSFGPTFASSLTSSLSGNLETGNLPYQRYRLDETLQLQHTPTFQTHYDYSLEQQHEEGVTQTLNNLDVGMSHHLFKSLITDADIGGSLLDATGTGEIQEAYARADTNYHKIVPYGLFLTNLSAGWQWQHYPGATTPIPVFNQPAAFNTSQPLVLTQTNIDPNSIRLLSPTGVPYLKGTDYTVNTVGHLIQIQRIVGGLIPPGGGVLLDYNLLPEPGHVTNTEDAGINVRYEIDKGFLSGLSPYARYGIQRQEIDARVIDSTLIADSYDDAVVGADYRIWSITLNAEQQWFHSTISPYNATRFSARYNSRLTANLSASLSGNYAMLDYYDVHDKVDDASVTAALEATITREFVARARAVWVDDEDRLFGNTRGLEEQIELEWTHNQTHVYARFRNASLSGSAQKSTFQEIDVGISRRF